MRKILPMMAVSACLSLFCVPMTSGASPDAAQEASVRTHGLTPQQKSEMEAIQAAAEKRAGPIAVHLAEVVKRIYDNMLADHPDEALNLSLRDDMKNTTWDLLSIKGQAIRDSVNLLNRTQKARLKEEMVKPGAPSDLTELIRKLF